MYLDHTSIPRHMSNDESKLYATIIVAQREIAYQEAIRTQSLRKLGLIK